MSFKYKLLIIFVVIIAGLSSIYFLGEDNIIEEISEKILQKETNIDIDLSPNSQENGKK